jgi:hypothetical protein
MAPMAVRCCKAAKTHQRGCNRTSGACRALLCGIEPARLLGGFWGIGENWPNDRPPLLATCASFPSWAFGL